MLLENAFPAIIFSKFSGGGPFASRLRRRLRATGGPPAAEPSLVGKHARAPPPNRFHPVRLCVQRSCSSYVQTSFYHTSSEEAKT